MTTPITVKDLIVHLCKLPQGLPVAYALHSEYCLLELKDIEIVALCEPRPDGWVQRERPDKLSIEYVVFPGN